MSSGRRMNREVMSSRVHEPRVFNGFYCERHCRNDKMHRMLTWTIQDDF
jgi:hypothetical protein